MADLEFPEIKFEEIKTDDFYGAEITKEKFIEIYGKSKLDDILQYEIEKSAVVITVELNSNYEDPYFETEYIDEKLGIIWHIEFYAQPDMCIINSITQHKI